MELSTQQLRQPPSAVQETGISFNQIVGMLTDHNIPFEKKQVYGPGEDWKLLHRKITLPSQYRDLVESCFGEADDTHQLGETYTAKYLAVDEEWLANPPGDIIQEDGRVVEKTFLNYAEPE